MLKLVPLLWKEDISRAFRRLPVFVDHLCFAGCVFMANNVKLCCKHLGLPFGSIASVHGWERMGDFLVTMLRVVALCPALRYVDDFFGVSVDGVTFNGGLMFRVLTALVGTLCDPGKSREFMLEMLILGADIMVDAAAMSFAAQLSAKKAKKWRQELKEWQMMGVMPQGVAAQFAGRLSFSVTVTASRCGRAFLRPFYAQAHDPLQRSATSLWLGLCVEWWLGLCVEDDEVG